MASSDGRPAQRPSLEGSRLSMATPADYWLPRDVCSYGYFLLAPNLWDVPMQALWRPLSLAGGQVLVRVTQRVVGGPLSVRCSRPLERAERGELRRLLTRSLRLDEPAEGLEAFHAADPRWRESGRGRLFRSPTLFEDIVKTVTSCNIAWTGTIAMNEALCRVLGRPVPGLPPGLAGAFRTFPQPQRLARARPGTLRGRCRVGYRDARLIELAQRFASGSVDEAWLQDPSTPDDDVYACLLDLPGVGPYAAGNIMQLLGRYSRLALDTESARHGRTVLGMTGTDREVLRAVDAHFAPFGVHRFRSYWFELWAFYEERRGPAHLWDRDTTGRTFTASKL